MRKKYGWKTSEILSAYNFKLLIKKIVFKYNSLTLRVKGLSFKFYFYSPVKRKSPSHRTSDMP